MIERSQLIFALLPWDPRSIAGWETTSGGSSLLKESTSRFWQNIRWESQYTMSYCSLRLNMKSVSKVLWIILLLIFKKIIYKPQWRKPSAYFLWERTRTWGEFFPTSCLHRHLIFRTTVRKASLKAVMLPVAQATVVLNLSLGRKAWILRGEQKGTQTQGLPRKINDKSL